MSSATGQREYNTFQGKLAQHKSIYQKYMGGDIMNKFMHARWKLTDL